MKEIFNHAYKTFAEGLNSIIDFFAMAISTVIVSVIYLTLPIWVLPYHFFVKKKEDKTEGKK